MMQPRVEQSYSTWRGLTNRFRSSRNIGVYIYTPTQYIGCHQVWRGLHGALSLQRAAAPRWLIMGLFYFYICSLSLDANFIASKDTPKLLARDQCNGGFNRSVGHQRVTSDNNWSRGSRIYITLRVNTTSRPLFNIIISRLPNNQHTSPRCDWGEENFTPGLRLCKARTS
jgi:hypothetical protein